MFSHQKRSLPSWYSLQVAREQAKAAKAKRKDKQLTPEQAPEGKPLKTIAPSDSAKLNAIMASIEGASTVPATSGLGLKKRMKKVKEPVIDPTPPLSAYITTRMGEGVARATKSRSKKIRF